MFKKILIGIILFGVVAVLLLQIDDELNPEVASFLEQAKPAESSDAYLYLLGIVAAEGEDPLVVGKQLFASMQQAEESYTLGDESFGYEGYPEEKLPLPQGELFCSWSECWQSIFFNNDEIEQTLKNNAVLLERYQTFTSLKDYRNLAKSMRMSNDFPMVEYLPIGNRLVILKAVNIARTSGTEQATKIIMENILKLRHNLERTETSMDKVFYTLMISDNLDALSLLAHQDSYDFNTNIPPLSFAERDFLTVMAHMFAESYEIIAWVHRTGDSSWWSRIFLKPNMTINDSLSFYKEMVKLSRLEHTEFASVNFENFKPSYNRPKHLKFKLSSKIRNYVGTNLNRIVAPFTEEFIGSLFDLNAKIAIFNQTANKVMLPEDLSYIQNPYYETGGTAFYSADGKSICLTGPLEDDDNQRCLRVKL